MSARDATDVRAEQAFVPPIRHPIKSARLLYTPPGYILRGPVHMIFIIAIGGLIYSCWATVDNIVTAPLTLLRQSTNVVAVGSGIVTEIGARANRVARYGDRMVVIQEQVRVGAETDKSQMLARQFQLKKERSETEDEYAHTLAQLRLDLEDLTTNRGSRELALKGRVQQIEQQLSLARGSLNRNLERQKLAQKQFERTRKLYESRDITISDFEAAQERVNDGAKAIDDDRKTIASVQVELTTARDDLNKLTDERAREKLESEIAQTEARRERDLKTIDEQIASTGGELERSKQLVEGVTFEENSTIYSSSFDGLVTAVPVNVGDLVGVGQTLFSMVRDTAPLYARVLVRNESIGNLAKGQDVKIKYFAYPYQEFGIQEGVISDIATKPGGVEGAESMYIVTVALKQETIARRGEKSKELEIGLEGLAEIKTGSKRMIELLFSPVSKFFKPEDSE